MLTLGRQYVQYSSDPMLCIYAKYVYICFSQVFIYKGLFQCLRILEVNLNVVTLMQIYIFSCFILGIPISIM